jgi:hypothetical protein
VRDVCMVSGSYYPREGGAERQMRGVLENLAGAGRRAGVITQAVTGAPRTEILNGVQIQRIGCVSLYIRVPPLGKLLFCIEAFLRLLVLRPRSVVSLQLGAASFAVCLAARVAPMRHIVRLTGGGTALHRSEPFWRASTRGGRMVVKAILSQRRATLVSPAKHLLEDFRLAFPNVECRQLTIANGIPRVAEGSSLEDERTGVLWYARRGSERSLATFLRIVEALPELRFVVIGQPVGVHVDNVSSLGWVSEPGLELSGVRICLNTSPSEGMPNIVLQAVAAGAYVVGGANRGLTEVRDLYPSHVHLVDLEDLASVQQAIEQLHALPLPGPAEVPSIEDVVRTWVTAIVGEQ